MTLENQEQNRKWILTCPEFLCEDQLQTFEYCFWNHDTTCEIKKLCRFNAV